MLHAYTEPPERMVELRSSLRLLAQPQAVVEAVVQLVREGKAERLDVFSEHKRAYRVEYGGDV
jgi:hypothetical protein